MHASKNLWIFGVLALAVFILLLVLIWSQSDLNKRDVPHRNLVDSKISLNATQPITVSAKETNPLFKKLAFAPVPAEKKVFSNQIAGVFTSIKYWFSPRPKSTEPREYGSWIWTPVLQMTPEYMDTIIAGAKANNINVIYVSIDSYLDIFTLPAGAAKDELEQKFIHNLEQFLAKASEQGVAVDAEGGWRNWAEEGNNYKAFAVVNFIKRYNETHTIKFRGFQYDIEPYLLDSYRTDQAAVLKNFISLVDQTQNYLSSTDLRFAVVAPDFYDARDEITPKFSYNGKNDGTFGHLLSILDKKSNNSIIIMSYRNFAEGKDGAIEISQNEMKTARHAQNTRVIIAQETGQFPPPYITFYSSSKDELLKQVGKINNAFSSNPAFGGLAFHYINSLMELK